MRRSFYHYMLTLRGVKLNNPETKFANDLAADIQFPKHSEDYHEISHYLEMEGDYLTSMAIFDDAWEKYLENNQ